MKMARFLRIIKTPIKSNVLDGRRKKNPLSILHYNIIMSLKIRIYIFFLRFIAQ